MFYKVWKQRTICAHKIETENLLKTGSVSTERCTNECKKQQSRAEHNTQQVQRTFTTMHTTLRWHVHHLHFVILALFHILYASTCVRVCEYSVLLTCRCIKGLREEFVMPSLFDLYFVEFECSRYKWIRRHRSM